MRRPRTRVQARHRARRYAITVRQTRRYDRSCQSYSVVDSLPAGGASLENIMVSAPATDGTYYVGACVDAVSGESNTDNQCSSGVQITVSTPIAPDMVVIDPSVSDSTLTPGQTFTIYATARTRLQARHRARRYAITVRQTRRYRPVIRKSVQT